MNEACIWQYMFFGKVWGEGGGVLKRCWHNIRRDGYLVMMLDYKRGMGGGGGGQESGEK